MKTFWARTILSECIALWPRLPKKAIRAIKMLINLKKADAWIALHPQVLQSSSADTAVTMKFHGSTLFLSRELADDLLTTFSRRRVFWPAFAKRGGLITVVVQDVMNNRDVLMVAFTDEAGFTETLRTGEAVYYSTSRLRRWKKGDESGDIQIVRDIRIDCDGDAIVLLIEQIGSGACHTKARSCFFRRCLDAIFIAPAPKFDEQKDGLEVREVDVCDRIRS